MITEMHNNQAIGPNADVWEGCDFLAENQPIPLSLALLLQHGYNVPNMTSSWINSRKPDRTIRIHLDA